VKRISQLLAVLLALSLLAAACGGSDSDSDSAASGSDSESTDNSGDDEHLGDGSLGVVTIEAGEAVQIRSLNAITGDVAFLGVPNQRGVEQAIADYGQINGFDVSMGTGLDDLCSADGGQAAAQTIVADEQVLGVIGTSCSGAATAAAPLIAEAGMVMISGSNTSPALTSDQQGTAGDNYNVGYYRTAHNDLFQGAAMAEFVFNQLGLTTAAAIHDGDPYTEGLASAFTNAFEALGGEVTGFTAVAKEDTDMVPVLTEIAAGSPQALFFPIFQPAGDFVADQASGVDGLEDTILLAADGLLVDGFLELEQTAGMHFSGPDTRFGQNANESTGVNAEEFLATYESNNGEAPSAPFWGHSYDATAMLLDAITAASWIDGDNLMVDRAGVREYLTALRSYEGIIGTINCDDFGDCGSQRITIIEHLNPEDIEASKLNVVYAYTPQGGSAEGDGEAAMGAHMGDGSLGIVAVEAGEAVQIRSLNAITGDVAFLGVPNQRGVEQAIADYGQINGFDVSMGTGLDDLCSADGGQAAAQTIVADEQVLGVIGTSCSGAATAAAPLIAEAGMVMISGSNTSPALTSDQQGTAGDNYNVGYYRTAHNDLFQGAAMAEFVFNQLGLTTAAAIHDGDPYTEGLASAFTNAFEALGGEVTGFTAVAKEDTDMVPVLTEIAAGSPQALFFPIFQPAGDFVADQASGVDGLEDTILLAADGLLVDGFLELEQTAGMHFSGPDTRFGQNANESTGVNAEEFLATYESNNGEAPSAPFWGHSYDATAMLLDAITAASWIDGDNLMVDRAGVREYLTALRSYEGIIGTINCDDFGDCGSQRITIIEHLNPEDIEASKLNVVYEYAPQ
jgi:branched-chain amino acid transport system substrate-binding protein